MEENRIQQDSFGILEKRLRTRRNVIGHLKQENGEIVSNQIDVLKKQESTHKGVNWRSKYVTQE